MGSYGRHRNTRRNKKRFAKANERRAMLAAEKEVTKDATELVEDTENLAVKTIDVVAEGAKDAIDLVADGAKALVGEKADEILERIPKSDADTEAVEGLEGGATEDVPTPEVAEEAPEAEGETPEAIEDIRANSPAKEDISEKAEVVKEEPKKAKKAPAKKKPAKKGAK